MQNCENLKVGDYVVVSRIGSRSLRQVEGITPKGFIKVDGTLYRTDGFQRSRGDVWTSSSIYPASYPEIEQFKQERFVASVVRLLRSISNLRYEQAVAINRILEEGGADNAAD